MVKRDFVALVNAISKEAYDPARSSPFFGDLNFAGTVWGVIEGRDFNHLDPRDPAVAAPLYDNLSASLEANGYQDYIIKLESEGV